MQKIKATATEGEPKTYTTKKYKFDPLTVNIQRCKVEDLKGGDPAQNAEEFEKDSIVLNAGMGCYVYGMTDTIEEGCAWLERFWLKVKELKL